MVSNVRPIIHLARSLGGRRKKQEPAHAGFDSISVAVAHPSLSAPWRLETKQNELGRQSSCNRTLT
jgi:hypothetical protein